MKVILLQDVAKIGKRFEVTEVPDGYATNQLIPKRMAEPATPANLKRIERRQAENDANKEASEAVFTVAKKALAEKTVTVTVDANEQGHLFKAVSEADVAEAAKAAGVDVEASQIKISIPIKSVGEHSLKLVNGVSSAEFTIEVVKK